MAQQVHVKVECNKEHSKRQVFWGDFRYLGFVLREIYLTKVGGLFLYLQSIDEVHDGQNGQNWEWDRAVGQGTAAERVLISAQT